VGGEDVTSEALTEVLNHVVTLGFTVDENVEVKLFLDLDNLGNLLLDELLVLLSGDLALGELVTLDTDLLGLREGTDSGGGEERKVDGLALLGKTDGEGRLAVVHLIGDSSLALLDLGVVGASGRGTSLNGLSVGLELVTDSSRALSDGLGDHNNLVGLLNSEAEPILDLRIEVLLALKGVGDVEERAGGGDNDSVLAKLLDSVLNLLDGSLEVGLPDVTTINNTSRENLLGAKSGNNSIELLRVADKVHVDTIKVVQSRKNINVVDNVTEVGGKDNAGSLVTESTKLLINRLEGSLGLDREIENENRLVNLNVLNTGSLQLGEEVNVEGNQVVDLVNRVNFLTAVGLGEGQEGDGTQDDGTSDDASLLGLEELSNGLGVGSELEDLVLLKGRLDVVVVRVEPLDHFLYISY
jgi:hypothetical protein